MRIQQCDTSRYMGSAAATGVQQTTISKIIVTERVVQTHMIAVNLLRALTVTVLVRGLAQSTVLPKKEVHSSQPTKGRLAEYIERYFVSSLFIIDVGLPYKYIVY